MTEVDDRPETAVDPSPHAAGAQAPAAGAHAPAGIAPPVATGAAAGAPPPAVLRHRRPWLALPALGAGVAAATAAAVVATAAPAGGAAAVAAAGGCAGVAAVLLGVAAGTRRRLHADRDGVDHGGLVRHRWHGWAEVARVEVTARGLRRPRIVLHDGRAIPVPRRAARAASSGVSPQDRLSVWAGIAGVPVGAAPPRRRLGLWVAVVVAGVVAGVALGLWVAAKMLQVL